MKFPIPPTVKEFSGHFTENGFNLFVVGGAVRDWVLGIDNQDWDFTTDALPADVQKLFKSTIPTGIKHGTVTVLFKGNSYEVTTFRTETTYSDKRHPDKVDFSKDLKEDLSRRDFTVNALAANCSDGSITDLFNGCEDLNKGVIKAIGNPVERFEEDALRLMRLCRFCAKLNFKPDENTLNAAKLLCKNINYVSKERIFEELEKTLKSPHPDMGIILLDKCGLLEQILPEVSALKKIEQTKINAKNAFEHTVLALSAAKNLNYSFTVRLALLLHDIGKVPAMTVDSNNILHFPNHDFVGGKMAEEVLKRLKCSNKLIDDTTLLISNHMVKYNSNWSDGAVKRFINRVGRDNINSLFELQWCDQIASEGKSKAEEYDEFISRIKQLEQHPMKITDLNITGEDLFNLGIPKNKSMGFILHELLEMVIDYPEMNKKEILSVKAIDIFKTKF